MVGCHIATGYDMQAREMKVAERTDVGMIAVCSQIHTKHTNSLCGQNVECRTYRAVNTLRLSYKNQPVSVVQ